MSHVFIAKIAKLTNIRHPLHPTRVVVNGKYCKIPEGVEIPLGTDRQTDKAK